MPNLVKISPVESKIALRFDNNEEYQIESLDLRFECPCASYVNEITGRRTLQKTKLKPDVHPLKIEPVGLYGIHIRWGDGHSTGMFHFDRLYELAKKLNSPVPNSEPTL